MKYQTKTLITLASALGLGLSSQATILVNDTWLDGDRSDPAAPVYSEYGVDGDLDGDIESAWYRGGVGTLAPIGPGGPLRGDLTAGATSSATWTTYFTSGAGPLSLVNAGDSLRVTWQFSVTGLGAVNTSQNFRLALVNSPSGAVLNADGAPGTAAYGGYGMFMNMSVGSLGGSNPFQLMERVDANTASALLSASGSWTGRGNGATAGNAGYTAGVTYTYIMELTLNGLGGLDIVSSMSGGSFNGSGIASVSFTDTTPNSLTYNTFSIRPSSATGAAQIFDTSLLRVELTQVPEPSSLALVGLGVFGLLAARRHGRR